MYGKLLPPLNEIFTRARLHANDSNFNFTHEATRSQCAHRLGLYLIRASSRLLYVHETTRDGCVFAQIVTHLWCHFKDVRLHKIALFVYIGVEVVTFLVQLRRATGQNIVMLLFSEHFYVNVEIVTTRKWRASLKKSFLLASFQLISFFILFLFTLLILSPTC